MPAKEQIDLLRMARLKEFQFMIDNFSVSQAAGMVKALEQTYKEIFDRMATGAGTKFARGRSVSMLDEIYAQTEALRNKLAADMATAAGVASSTAASTHSKIFSFDGAVPNAESVTLSAATMSAYWSETPVGGKLLQDWVNGTFDINTRQKIKDEIGKGLLQAESFADMRVRLEGSLDATGRDITTLVKTYVQSANMDALKKVYKANNDLVKKVRWVATFEGGGKSGMGTCMHCAWLDGQVFKEGDAPRIPFHPRCRCTLSPVTGDLGITDEDFKKSARPFQMYKDGAVSRNGKNLLEAGRFKGSYEDWLKAMPDHVLKNTVGKGRFDLIKAGKIGFRDLLDPKTLKIRRLDELVGLPAKKVAQEAAKKKAFAQSIQEGMAKKKAAKVAAGKKAAEKAKVDAAIKSTAKSTEEAIKKAAVARAAVAAEKKAAAKAAKEAVIAKKAAEEAAKKKAFSDKIKAGMAKAKAKKEAAAKAAKEAAEQAAAKAAAEAAKKKEFSDKIKAGMEKAKAKKLTEKNAALVDEYMEGMLAGEEVSIEQTAAWIESATKEQAKKLNAALEEIYKKKEFSDKIKAGMAKAKAKKEAVAKATKEVIDEVKPPKHAKADLDWEATGNPKNFTHVGRADVGGAHAKDFYVDSDGNKWLFKPNEPFLAYADETAYKVGRVIDPDAIEVRFIELDGRTGSIQKMQPDLKDKFDFGGMTPAQLTKAELEQIQREHVIDWLVSNHDGHTRQFIRGKNGKVYGIDKGQAYKHLGDDMLSIDYHPNGVYGEQEPFYNTIFREAKKGKLDVDPGVTLKYIKRMEDLPDDDFMDMVRPYAEARFKGNPAGLNKFYADLLKRKQNLRKDFEKYYSDVLNEPNFKFEKVEAPKPVPKAKPKAKKADDIPEEFFKEVDELGQQGKSLNFDLDDIEDQNALVFTETFNGKTRTVVKMKVRPEAARKIDNVIAKQDVSKKVTASGSQPIPADNFYDDMVTAIKNINYHKGASGSINQAKLDKALDHFDDLWELTLSKDKNIKAMAEEYIRWMQELEKAVKEGRAVNGQFKQFLREPSKVKAPKKAPSDFTVTQTQVTQTQRRLENGRLVATGENGTNDNFFGYGMNEGKQFDIDFPDGTKVRYRPYDSDTPFAQQGELEVIFPKKATAESMKETFKKLDDLGIDAKMASRVNNEKMYLEKLAYVRKEHQSAAWKKLVKDLDNTKASPAQRVKAYKEYFNEKLRVMDISKLKAYDPEGKYNTGFLNKEIEGGNRVQFRPDISETQLNKDMPGYSLRHNITAGGGVEDLIETIMDGNGAMISTVEKMRLGIKPSGMSPSADMGTGGANYFFTRITNLNNSGVQGGSLYFKKDMLRRMDSVSYNHDAYGKVKGDYVTKNRASSTAEWKKHAGNGGNETIFKDSVMLLENIEYIVLNYKSEVEDVIKTFKKHGVSKLPDGRKIEDVVFTKDSWRRRSS